MNCLKEPIRGVELSAAHKKAPRKCVSLVARSCIQTQTLNTKNVHIKKRIRLLEKAKRKKKNVQSTF